MIKKDYFLRLIEEFMVAISKFLEKKEDQRDAALKDLYRQYVGDFELLRNANLSELQQYAAEQWSEDERIDRLEMVGELLYLESQYKQQPLRTLLCERAMAVLNLVDSQSRSYSIDRRQKIARLKAMLNAQ